MTKHDLKELAAIGAELGAAKAENEKLRAEVEALRVALLGIASANPAERSIEWAKSYASDGLKGAGSELYARWLETFKEAEALRKDADRRATLSNQAEPTDTYTAVDMATAAAQGFRDGQAAVEPAPEQDEQSPEQMLSREQIENIARKVHGDCIRLPGATYQNAAEAAVMYTLERIARPAQTATQPEQSGLAEALRPIHAMILNALDRDAEEGKAARGEMAAELRAALSAQGAGDADS